jgi:hypothetical protein
MISSTLFIAIIAIGGLALSYLIEDDEPFIWRVAVGIIAGSGIFGLALFLIACVAGLSSVTVIAAAIVSMLPALIFRKKQYKNKLKHDWNKAKGRMQGFGTARFLAFAYYAGFFLLFLVYFSHSVYQTAEGLFTGGSQNLGDMPFHLGAIFSFTEGNNFPPDNPSWAGAKFTYPFIADLVSAAAVKLGFSISTAINSLNIAWAFSLLIVLERFTLMLTESRVAARIAPALLIFSGGFGFLWFLNDFSAAGKGLTDFLMALPQDYTIGDKFRWGNSMVVLFITQRSFLLGLPLTVIVLHQLWKYFTAPREEAPAETKPLDPTLLPPLIVGLMAGLLPLIHLHSLVVLFVVTGFLFFMRLDRWRVWIAFGIGVSVVAVPILIWSLTGSATDSTKFFGWHFGWDKRNDDFITFWIKNTGLTIPLILAGIGFIVFKLTRKPDEESKDKSGDANTKKRLTQMLLFYIPFAVLFVISNVFKLAPWEWDNIKILIYWLVGSLPIIAYLLAEIWKYGIPGKAVAWILIVGLTASGALDVWRAASGQVKIRVFDTDAVRIAEQIKGKTEPKALFLNAPTYNSAVVLSGRRSLMRYSGHLSSHGINHIERENDTRQIYQGGGTADILLRKHNIEYVMVGPEERGDMKPNDEFFKKFPVIAESGQYRVYKVDGK